MTHQFRSVLASGVHHIARKCRVIRQSSALAVDSFVEHLLGVPLVDRERTNVVDVDANSVANEIPPGWAELSATARTSSTVWRMRWALSSACLRGATAANCSCASVPYTVGAPTERDTCAPISEELDDE
jgi:hypothetical protein